jgi:hypothetical protein
VAWPYEYELEDMVVVVVVVVGVDWCMNSGASVDLWKVVLDVKRLIDVVMEAMFRRR